MIQSGGDAEREKTIDWGTCLAYLPTSEETRESYTYYEVARFDALDPHLESGLHVGSCAPIV